MINLYKTLQLLAYFKRRGYMLIMALCADGHTTVTVFTKTLGGFIGTDDIVEFGRGRFIGKSSSEALQKAYQSVVDYEG